MPSAIPGEHIYTANKLQREVAGILGVELGPKTGKDQPDFLGPGYVGEMKATFDTGVRAVFLEQFERYDAMSKAMEKNSTLDGSNTTATLFYAIVKYKKKFVGFENGDGMKKLDEMENTQTKMDDWERKKPIKEDRIESIYIIDGEVMRKFFETMPKQRTMWNLKGMNQVRRRSVKDKNQNLLTDCDREELVKEIVGPEWIGLPKTAIDTACPYMWMTPEGIPIYYSGAKGVTITSESKEDFAEEQIEQVVRMPPMEELRLDIPAHIEAQGILAASASLFHVK